MKTMISAASLALLVVAGASPVLAQDWSGPYVGVYGGYLETGEEEDERLIFDRDFDGQFDDTVVLNGTNNSAFSPGSCDGVGLSNSAAAEIVGFIPVLGGAVAGLAPPLFALVQFESYWPALILLGGLQAILFIVGNFIQPRMQGENQNIDPVVVLLSLALWGQLWGVVGMFLSTPLAVMAMAILAEFKGSRWVAILMSGDGEPYADEPAAKSSRKPRVKAPQSEASEQG